MAKRRSAGRTKGTKLEDFAEDLGRLLGTARGKAETWLNQRQSIVKNLTELRDTATKLLADLGQQAQKTVARRHGRPRKQARQTAGGNGSEGAPAKRRRKRGWSAAARKAAAARMKAYWAKRKAGRKK
jgi:hypothetical protein